MLSAEKSVPLAVLQEVLARPGDTDTPLAAAIIEQRLRTKGDESGTAHLMEAIAAFQAAIERTRDRVPLAMIYGYARVLHIAKSGQPSRPPFCAGFHCSPWR